MSFLKISSYVDVELNAVSWKDVREKLEELTRIFPINDLEERGNDKIERISQVIRLNVGIIHAQHFVEDLLWFVNQKPALKSAKKIKLSNGKDASPKPQVYTTNQWTPMETIEVLYIRNPHPLQNFDFLINLPKLQEIEIQTSRPEDASGWASGHSGIRSLFIPNVKDTDFASICEEYKELKTITYSYMSGSGWTSRMKTWIAEKKGVEWKINTSVR